MNNKNEIREAVRSFIASNSPNLGEVTNDTKLVSSGMMDSIVALKLVSFLEEKFGIEFEAHEVDQDNLDTIDIITRFVQSKQQ
jgi:acyl carrier protein